METWARMECDLAMWVDKTGLEPWRLMDMELPPVTSEADGMLYIHKDHVMTHPVFYHVHKAFLADSKAIFEDLHRFANREKPNWQELIVRPTNAFIMCNLEPKFVTSNNQVYLVKPWHCDDAPRHGRPFVRQDGKLCYLSDGLVLEPFRNTDSNVEMA